VLEDVRITATPRIGKRIADGGWRMEDGRWKMEDGRWKMEG
jgi:hypothetical protein